MPGVIAVEHGYGHCELGARAHLIGERQQPQKQQLAAGININDLGPPTRPIPAARWVDTVSGASVRKQPAGAAELA